jgi:tetratricopeptide (TPR) repeat protein
VHTVVADLSRFVLWVCRGPYLLGKFVAIDLRELFGLPIEAGTTPEAIAEDPLWGTPQLEQYELSQRQRRLAQRLRRAGKFSAALDHTRRALQGNPDSAMLHLLQGDLAWQLNQKAAAIKSYQRFLSLHPPYLADAERIQRLLSGTMFNLRN